MQGIPSLYWLFRSKISWRQLLFGQHLEKFGLLFTPASEHTGDFLPRLTVINLKCFISVSQKGDRAIKLYCFFEVGDKTVTNGYDVIADTIKPGSTSIKVHIRLGGIRELLDLDKNIRSYSHNSFDDWANATIVFNGWVVGKQPYLKN